MLFAPEELQRPARAPDELVPRPRVRVPIGGPRVVESSARVRMRLAAQAWQRLMASVARSSEARLQLLSGPDSGLVDCPWKVLTPCTAGCRCEGLGKVRVGFLRGHYAQLAAEIALLCRRSTSW